VSADTETIGSGSAPAEPVASSGAVDPVVSPFAAGSVVSPFAAGSVVSPFANDLPVIEITEAALETVLNIRAGEDNPDELGLRIEITGSRGSEYTYDLSFDEISNAVADDQLIEASGVTVIVPAETVEKLRGSVLDLPRTAGQGGLVIRNPNRPDPLAGIDLDLEGTIAEQVEQLLEQAINPSLAAHGGFASLVGVDESNNVYVKMGGGCQGCSASALTLAEGIKRQIKDLVPDVLDVIDATDHQAGENPFYK
jgi:Fe/S biogenesis protein NfuA